MHRRLRKYVPVGTAAPKFVLALGVTVALCGCGGAQQSEPPRAPSDRSLLPLSAAHASDASTPRDFSGATPSERTSASPDRGARNAVSWLGPREVGQAVRAHGPAFTACHTLADATVRRRDGAVTVGWLVEPDGATDDVTIGASTFDSREIDACVLSVARRVRFPATLAPTRVSWTVRFRGAGDGSLANARRALP